MFAVGEGLFKGIPETKISDSHGIRLKTEKRSSTKRSKVKYDLNAVKAPIEFGSVSVTYASCRATTR